MEGFERVPLYIVSFSVPEDGVWETTREYHLTKELADSRIKQLNEANESFKCAYGISQPPFASIKIEETYALK